MFGNMLTLHSINPTGMFSYGRSENVNLLNRGLVHLVGCNEDKGGDSNGAGKSSLFNAICELLFRENPTGEKGDSLINTVWGKGFAGRIMFTNWEGVHYRVTYCRKWKDHFYPVDNDNQTQYIGTGLFLDKFDDGVWRDARGSGMPETHKKIVEIVGMTYKEFLSIAYMTHRVGSQFLRGTNKERMDILSGITGIEAWDTILDKCRSEKKSFNAKINDLGERVAFEQGSVQTLKEQLQGQQSFDWDRHIKGLESSLGECRLKWKDRSTKLKELEDSIKDLQIKRDASYNKDKVDEINREVETIKRTLSIEENKLRMPINVNADASLQEAFNSTVTELGSLQGELRALKGGSASLLDIDSCPVCESKITESKKTKILTKINGLEANIDLLEKKKVEQKTEVDRDLAEKKTEEETKKNEIHIKVNELREQINAKYRLIQEEQELYTKLEGEIQVVRNRLPDLNSELNQLQAEGAQLKAQIEQAKVSVSNITALEGQIHEKERQIGFFNTEINEVNFELSKYLWLIDNIPYIKLHKMSRAMTEISELCNQYFDEMGESIRINISSFDEKVKKKNAADIKDLMKSEVKVDITDGSKHISPKLYSDGELSKVSLAIIRSLHEMARKSGQGCNVMLMDEIFSFVDMGNSQKIAQSLSNFLSKGTVLLTDNSGSVNNLINFDHVWVARKKEGQTVIETD